MTMNHLASLLDPAPLSKLPIYTPPGQRNPAELAVERLGKEIAAFEANLSNEEEIGGIIIGAPGNTTSHY